jgi:ssDNA-binding replication factor A large subunit
MSVEKIIQEILSKRPQVSKREITEKLEKEKSRINGLISDEILLRMIGAEFGVEFSNNTSMLTLSSADLVPGLNDVTVVGRVIAVFSPKTFEGNRSGEIASVLVADQKGILRVVFWNDKTNLIKSGQLKSGQIVRFSHGYTKEDYSGKVELHLGEKSEIETNPSDAEEKDYPTIEKFASRISEISMASKNKRMNLLGSVKEVFSSSTFTRQDSSDGKVMHFVLADKTGEISVVVWNEKVDKLENVLKKGVVLALVNAKVKKAMNEGLEVHVDSGTYIETIASAERFWKIGDLKAGMNSVNVEGEVASKPLFRDVKTSKGEVVRLAVLELKDETGKMWVSAWRRHAESVEALKVGDRIILKNAYVKKGFGDQPEISTKDSTTITTVS